MLFYSWYMIHTKHNKPHGGSVPTSNTPLIIYHRQPSAQDDVSIPACFLYRRPCTPLRLHPYACLGIVGCTFVCVSKN